MLGMLNVDWSFSIPLHERKMILVTPTRNLIVENSHAIFYVQAISMQVIA
jgi:hypothetical protein